MYQHLLVPTDGSELSSKAVAQAGELAQRLGARVTLLYVQPDFPQVIVGEAAVVTVDLREDYLRGTAEQAERILAEASAVVEGAGVGCQRRTAVGDAPWQTIVNTAEAEHCDLVFMASHGRSGLVSLLIGSETRKVLTHCKIPVLVYR